jgi:hypothetical protein
MARRDGLFTGNPNADMVAPQVNITPSDLKTLQCENCKGEVFADGMIIKTVSSLLTGNGKEGMLPIPAFYCVKCHEVVDRYLPEDMRKKPLVV